METKSKIKVFLAEKAKTLADSIAFINAEHITPVSIGSVLLKDGNLFTTISYNDSADQKNYAFKEVVVGNVSDSEELLVSELENSVPEGNIVCHENIVDSDGVLSIIYLIEE